MKSIYLTLALLFTLSTFAQKKNINGKIYDKHPAIDLVDQFTSAFVKGDSAAITNLVSENFSNLFRPRLMTSRFAFRSDFEASLILRTFTEHPRPSTTSVIL